MWNKYNLKKLNQNPLFSVVGGGHVKNTNNYNKRDMCKCVN